MWLINKCIVNAACIAYPIDRVVKHQKYITDATFVLVKQAARTRKDIFRVQTRIKFPSCKLCFRVWASNSFSMYVPYRWSLVHAFAEKCDARIYITQHINWRTSHNGVKSMLKLEHAAEIDRIYDQTNFELTSDNPSTMHEGVRRAMHIVKHKNAKTLRVCDSDGCPAASLHDERVLFQNHFTKVFKAQVKPFSELVDEMRNGLRPNYGEIIPDDLSEVFRTRVQLSSDCNLNRKANACGEDLVVPELLKSRAKCLSTLLFPLRAKVVC